MTGLEQDETLDREGTWAEVRRALDQLDGTRLSRIALLTGFTKEHLLDLGGVGEDEP